MPSGDYKLRVRPPAGTARHDPGTVRGGCRVRRQILHDLQARPRKGCARFDFPPMSPAKNPDAAIGARLLSLASHEIRTPISVVSGYLRMLQRDNTLTERQRKMIDEADKACLRLADIATEMSAIGKLEDGRTMLQSEGLDLFALLREVASGIDDGRDRGITVALSGCNGRGPTRGDRAHLKAALVALIRAVVREQPDDAEVRVQCSVESDGVHIAIGNADLLAPPGPAAPAPFDEERSGLGLSLPIARRVIEGHGGRIWSPAGPNGAPEARSTVFVVMPVSVPPASGV